MTRLSGDAAVAAARKQTSCDKGMCLSTVQEWWQSGHAYPDAQAQWNATEQHKGDRNPPIGAPVFYKGGRHGHIAIYVGGGNIRSTDCKNTYVVSESDLDWPSRAWGYSYLGWGGTLAGVRLPIGQQPEEDDMTPEQAQQLASVLQTVQWLNAWKDEVDPVIKETHTLAGWVNEWKDGITPTIDNTAAAVGAKTGPQDAPSS